MYIFFYNDTATTEIYTLSLHGARRGDADVLRDPHVRRGVGCVVDDVRAVGQLRAVVVPDPVVRSPTDRRVRGLPLVPRAAGPRRRGHDDRDRLCAAYPTTPTSN